MLSTNKKANNVINGTFLVPKWIPTLSAFEVKMY